MRRVILDTDISMGSPGSEIDDGFAMAIAVAEPSVRLELVTTVHGNTDAESATYLGLELLERLGRPDVPVIRGARGPLLHPEEYRDAPQNILEAYGHHIPAAGYAAVEIVRRVMAGPGEITLVAVGPLTNVALALALEPRIAQALHQLVVMGGVFTRAAGLTVTAGEFNIRTDPDAAAAVFASRMPIRAVGLDVTLQTRLRRKDAVALSRASGRFAAFAGEHTLAWLDRKGAGDPGDPEAGQSCAMHDPLAMAVVARPDLVSWQAARVRVDTSHGPQRGVTVTSPPSPGDTHTCEVGVGVDVAEFSSYLLDRLAGVD